MSNFHKGNDQPSRNPVNGLVVVENTSLTIKRSTSSKKKEGDLQTNQSSVGKADGAHGQRSAKLPDTWRSKNNSKVGKHAGTSTQAVRVSSNK